MNQRIINKTHCIPAAFALSVLMAACGTTPTTTSLLDQARGDYMAAQSNPAVVRDAPAELQQATAALDRANAAAAHHDSLNTIDSLAYAAKQRIAAAQQVARQKSAEREAADAGRQRDQVLVQERTREADQQRQNARQAQAQAQSANAQAQAASDQAQAANAQASALQQELADLKAKQTDRGLVITFGDVLFNVDQAQLSAQGMRTAERLADVLRQKPTSSVLVEGFTDSTGSPDHNLALSQRRAEAVRNALTSMGVTPERIATRGYGEAYPVASNDNAGNRQLNRRVEIVLSQDGAPIANRH